MRAVTERCQRQLDANTVFARYGGEEFALLLPDATGASAGACAERLRRALAEEPVTVGNVQLVVTLSAGVAMQNAAHPDLHLLLGAADAALYQAKRGGKNRVVGAPATAAADEYATPRPCGRLL